MQPGGPDPGHTVLQVPVPELETFVRARYEHYDPAYLSADPTHVHAHVTVLGPFVAAPTAEDLARVEAVVAASPPFEFMLAELATFPDGIIHLLPEPAAPFAALTRVVHAEFPEHPPYEGRIDSPVPHLTLDLRSDRVTEASTRALLGSLIPRRCRAERVDLVRYAPGGTGRLASFGLGRGPGEAGQL